MDQTPNSFLNSTKTAMKDVCTKYGLFFILGLGLVLLARFGGFIMDLIASDSKKDLENQQANDDKLKTKETQENQQANTLVQQADQLPSQQPPVADDWYKDKK